MSRRFADYSRPRPRPWLPAADMVAALASLAGALILIAAAWLIWPLLG